MSSLPNCPFVEQDEEALLSHLDAHKVDDETRRVAIELSRDGLAKLDLGDDETLAKCDQAIAELEPEYLYPGKANRVQDAWRSSPAVRELATDKRITDFLRIAYGREPFAFQTLNFLFGSQQGAHSDVTHFHAEPERFMCGVWLALEDVHEDAGALLYYPGSHRLPLMTPPNMGITKQSPTKADYRKKGGDALHALVAENKIEPAMGAPKKGQAMIWAANLFHGGFAD
ncbi:MAG: phytanoyl-CoA dioxygenase family protein [Pseudomonadota bacterium]